MVITAGDNRVTIESYSGSIVTLYKVNKPFV